MEQHGTGVGVVAVGVGPDDDGRQLRALVVRAGQRLGAPGLPAARIAVVGGGAAGAAVAGATVVVLASGVLETVESPEPQPASSSGTAAIQTHFTDGHRTVISPVDPAGARQVEAVPASRLTTR